MTVQHIDAVLVDFDHTLAHLGHFVRWEDARKVLLPLYRVHGVPKRFLDTHAGALDLYRDVAIAGLLRDAALHEAQRQASRVLAAFEAEAIPRTCILPEGVALLRWLPELGLPAGVVSSNAVDVVSAMLERDGVAAAFGAVVGREDVASLKPSPEGLLLCCAALGVAPERCIYVGDSASDIEAARAARIAGFGVRAGMSSDAELLAAGAEAVCDNVGEMLDLLRSI